MKNNKKEFKQMIEKVLIENPSKSKNACYSKSTFISLGVGEFNLSSENAKKIVDKVFTHFCYA